jgi:hypothetical protein
MLFSFGKNKNELKNKSQDAPKRSLDQIEADVKILNPEEMNRLGGGKETTKSIPDLRDSLGGTIPL